MPIYISRGRFTVRFGSDESRSVRTTESVPFPPARPSQHTLRPATHAPVARGRQLTDTPRDKRAQLGHPC
jgi:hypothetical protein